MKKFLAVMLMVLCAGAFAGEVVVQNETLGKPIRDKSIYTFTKGSEYVKVVNDDMLFSCTEVDGKISSMIVLFNQLPNYADAMSFALKMMTTYSNKYNKGVYMAYGENFFVTRYNGNNTVSALVIPNDRGKWSVSFTFKKLNKNGVGYIKYEQE